MPSLNPVIDTLTNSLTKIAWMLVATIFVVTILAMAYKLIEKKLLSMIDKKIYEAKKKKEEIKSSPKGLTIEEQELANQIRVERSGPSFEEWKKQQENK